MTSSSHQGPERWGPLALAAAIYLGLTGLLLWLGLQHTGGTFVYPQDDPYIHMTIARTLAEHGVWGIRPDEFASASSSPLWTVLLAVLWTIGARAVWLPLLLNVVAGVGVLAVVNGILRHRLDAPGRVLALVALILVTPLPTLALIGMEHTLQVLLVVVFTWTVAGIVEEPDTARATLASVLAAVLVATRYEGLFVVAAAGLVLAYLARPRLAAALACAAFMSLAASGAYFLSHGGSVLPNSVLMKSQPGRFATLGDSIAALLSDWTSVVTLFSRPPELVLVLGVLVALALAWPSVTDRWDRARVVGATFVIAALLHTAFVKLEWFFRYEAYLMALGVIAMTLVAADSRSRDAALGPFRRSAAGALVLVVLALPLATRALSALAVSPGAIRNVYEQQYQMGLFFSESYPDDAIAVNDIGAVSWLSSSRVIDIYGLATQEVADLKRHRQWSDAALEALVAHRGVKAVAIYEKVFARLIPRSWTLVGEWTISGNVGVSEDTVGFYAPTGEDAPRLRRALDEYAVRLPKTVGYRRP